MSSLLVTTGVTVTLLPPFPPPQDYFKLVDEHWEHRCQLSTVALPHLDKSMEQYYAVQEAIFEQSAHRDTTSTSFVYSSKSEQPLGKGSSSSSSSRSGGFNAEDALDTLWQETHADVSAALETVQDLRAKIARVSAKIAPCTRLMILLIG